MESRIIVVRAEQSSRGYTPLDDERRAPIEYNFDFTSYISKVKIGRRDDSIRYNRSIIYIIPPVVENESQLHPR